MADYKFLQHIDGAWRQLKRWVMYKYSGTPSDAQEGSFWYDTATKTPKYHNGTIAKDIGKYVVAGTGTTVSASGNDLAVNVTYGTVANTSCVGNDSRLSNARTPISHAVSATTYGVGTSSNYGHVKLYTSIGNNTDGAPTNSAVSGALALKANVSQLTDGSVTKVGTASVGSTTVPVYVNAGTLTACSGTLGVSITGNAATATTATKLGSTTVGSTTQPIYLNAGVPTAITSTVGSTTVPVYVNAGVMTACSGTLGVSITGNAATATTATKLGSSTVGSTSQPIYLNAGVPTAITGTISNSTTGNAATATKLGSATIGSASVPIYLNNGTPTVCTKVDLDAKGLFSAGYTSRSIDTPVASVDGEYIVYRSNTPTGTVPATSSWWYVTEHRHNATYYEQTMTDYFSNRSYHRIMNNGTWGAWREVAYTDSFTSEYVSKVDTNTQSIASQLQTYKSIYNHASSGTRGTAGHFKVCTMTVTSAFVNRPIEMTIVQRRKVKSTRLSIAFAGLESLDPTLSSFVYFGDSVDAYLYKSATSTWELYVTKIENYDNLQVIEFNDPHNYMPNIVWDTTQVSTIPSGSTAAVAYTLNNNTSGNAATATKLGSTTVGSASQPIYLNAGVATACNGSVGSATQPTYVNAGVNTACSGTLGVSITGNAATATTATKIGTTTIGSTNRPVYINNGVPSSLSDTVGNNRRPVYLNAGALTAISDTVGSSDIPVYSNNGTLTACNQYFQASTGTYTSVESVGSKNNYKGISAPGALRVNFMSRTDDNKAGLYCETDLKWMVLRNLDGTLKTDYAPATTSNSNEIATTAFVNSRINAQPQEYTYSIYNGTDSMFYATNAFKIACNLVVNQAHQAEAILSFSVFGNMTAANNYAGRVYMACKAEGTSPTYNVQILEGTSNIDNCLKWRSDKDASTINCTIMFAIPAWASLNIKLDSLNGGGTWTSAFASNTSSTWTTYGTMLTYNKYAPWQNVSTSSVTWLPNVLAYYCQPTVSSIDISLCPENVLCTVSFLRTSEFNLVMSGATFYYIISGDDRTSTNSVDLYALISYSVNTYQFIRSGSNVMLVAY